MSSFLQAENEGQILEISLVKSKLEIKLGKKIAKSSVYELLHRHGWRKGLCCMNRDLDAITHCCKN